jgi:CII-binding regulator of phage lambda lysogenization HflD
MTNGTSDYKLGEICTELKELQRRFSENDIAHKEIKDRIEEMKESVEDLNIWRWKTIGAFSVIIVVINYILPIAIAKLS